MAASQVDVAWTRSAEDRSAQAYIRLSLDMSSTTEVLRTKELATGEDGLAAQVQQLQEYLPNIQKLTSWPLDSLTNTRIASETTTRLRSERDSARAEVDGLKKKLEISETIMARLAQGPALTADPQVRAEKIADPKEFDGAREKLKAFKDQLIVKTSGDVG